MRTRFDTFAKSVAEDILAPLGTMQTQVEVPGSVQYIDALFEPDPVLLAADKREGLGLMRRMFASASMLEFFHEPPRVIEVRDCIRKQHQLDGLRARKARIAKEPRPLLPTLWLLSAGEPSKAIATYELRPMPGWPDGFYTGSKGLGLHLVVLRDLPERRDTLCLRLFGAGVTFARAFVEFASLPEDAWELQVVRP